MCRSSCEVRAGFIPLLDCAPLVIACEVGFDRLCGLVLDLQREVSWANIRDKVDLGALDCAHMLAPMPIAAALGVGRATEPVIAPMALNLNGNAITVSRALFAEMLELDGRVAMAGGMQVANQLAEIVRRRQANGREPLTFGMVFPFSCHNYDLRYWLAASSIDPDNDVNLVVVPPPLLTEILGAGKVDGFCVGAPWSSVSAMAGYGQVVATKSQLWSRSPEKVLGVRQVWAQRNPELTLSLVRALVLAAQWLEEPSNRPQAARILANSKYVGVAEEVLLAELSGKVERGGGLPPLVDSEMIVFSRGAANFPWLSHAIWLLTQMVRWGQAREPFRLRTIAERVYRPDLYRDAVLGLGVDVPAEDYKTEGGIRGAAAAAFFGAETFDPRTVIDYLQAFVVRSCAVDLAKFARLNA